MLRNTTLVIVIAAASVFGLAGCGDAANTAQAPQSQAQQEKDAANKPKDAAELTKDVRIVECASGAGIGVKATLEITNSQATPMEYLGKIRFLDATGKELTEGIFNTGTLQPGEKITEEIPGANVYEVVKKATCEVTEVKLDEPA